MLNLTLVIQILAIKPQMYKINVIAFHNPFRGPHRVYILGVNITDKNHIVGKYLYLSIMVLLPQQRVIITTVTHACAHPHRLLHNSDLLSHFIESMRPL